MKTLKWIIIAILILVFFVLIATVFPFANLDCNNAFQPGMNMHGWQMSQSCAFDQNTLLTWMAHPRLNWITFILSNLLWLGILLGIPFLFGFFVGRMTKPKPKA